MQQLVVALGAAALIGALLVFGVGRRVVEPLECLSGVSRQVMEGDLTVSANLRGNDEIAVFNNVPPFIYSTAVLGSGHGTLVGGGTAAYGMDFADMEKITYAIENYLKA